VNFQHKKKKTEKKRKEKETPIGWSKCENSTTNSTQNQMIDIATQRNSKSAIKPAHFNQIWEK